MNKKSLTWSKALNSQPLLFLLSFLLVASAQPDWSVLACILTSSIGYALFWKGMLKSSRPLKRFLLATVWFGSIQAVHLSWFMSDRYVGIYIFPFLILLFLALGVQFGITSLLISHPSKMGFLSMAGISGLWALMEWGRLFVLSGFSFNPLGLALSGTLYGMQFASAFGVYGMSFWIFFTNLMVLKFLSYVESKAFLSLFAIISLTPYLFGFTQVTFHANQMQKDQTPFLRAALVQTALSPEEKQAMEKTDTPLSPLLQWERILAFLYSPDQKKLDLIVLPEATVPYGTDVPFYSLSEVKHAFETIFGSSDALPITYDKKVSNSYWAQALANQFHADVAIGLEDADFSETNVFLRAYNAAFLFSPFSQIRQRYEKRVLVPMGEYIPFKWCRTILRKYGIFDSFAAGSTAKVFATGRVPLGVSICYEETYGHLMRECRQKGAGALVNLTNDVWYPHSRLPIVHFLHGRLRAIEGGMPILRACNTGVTCGIDSLGRVIDFLDYDQADSDPSAGTLYLSLPLYSYSTFYTVCGDWPVVSFSASAFLLLIANSWFKRKKRLDVNNLDIYSRFNSK